MFARKALTGAYPAGNTYVINYITVSSTYGGENVCSLLHDYIYHKID